MEFSIIVVASGDKKADSNTARLKIPKVTAGCEICTAEASASFVFAATPRPQNTSRTNFYSVNMRRVYRYCTAKNNYTTIV